MRTVSVAFVFLLTTSPAWTGDWPSWRGPEQNGVSRDTGLPGTWSLAGENVVWKKPFGGRSTPVVLGDRVYIVNRAGSGPTEEERVLCLSARNGETLWEKRFGIFLTDIASNRVGWASPAADPETGNVYAHGVQGTFLCLDPQGKTLWERSLHEEFGMISGYGGRITSPVVDGDLVIISFLCSSWGKHAPGGHRYVAFDKRSGSIVWWSEPGGKPLDTTYSVPIVRVVNGSRLLIDGNADGGIHAIEVRTGRKVWDFNMAKRGINPSLVFGNGMVYACHSEENIDSTAMGRVVCIDPSGRGDVTKTHEKWRIDGLEAGYSSPAFHDGRLYVFDNSANLHAIDAATGKVAWKHSVGTVMKGSPVVADGKIYVGEVTARFAILEPSAESCKTLSEINFPTPDGTIVELNGSPAISNGRIFFTTRDETYCLGLTPWTGTSPAAPPPPAEEAIGPNERPAHVRISPADVVLAPGESVQLEAHFHDALGRDLGKGKASFAVKGLKASIDDAGKLAIAPDAGFGAAVVEARLESLVGEARVRVIPKIPFRADFEDIEEGKAPPGWVGAGIKFKVVSLDGSKVLRKMPDDVRFADGEIFIGRPEWTGYTIAADVRGSRTRRQMPNITLLNSRYQMVLVGNQQRLRLVGWMPMPRLDKTMPFEWKPDTWYRMKLRAEVAGGKGRIRGKVWLRGEAEPAAWTIEVEDPAPYPSGSPGFQAYSAGVTTRSPGADTYFDNVEVTPNEALPN
jgi:outer membrane protein assembly factor BamB